MTKPQTYEYRKHLYALGYKPLPLKGKRCLLKGWSQWENDAIEVHLDADYPNTGVRCDGLCVIDIDVDDIDVTERLAGLCDPAAPLRFREDDGRALLVFRGGDTGKRVSTKFLRNGRVQCVEVLRGPGFQFAAAGVHPKGGTWAWGGDGLVPVEDLPEPPNLDRLFQAFERMADEAGWERYSAGEASGSEDDLTLDMTFETVDGEAMTVDQMRRSLGPEEEMWVHLTAFRPGSDSGAGHVKWSRNGMFQITDYVTGVVHHLPLETTISEAEGRMAKRKPAQEGERAPELQRPEVKRARALQDRVYVESEHRIRRLSAPEKPGSTVEAVRIMYGADMVNEWLRSEDCARVTEVQFRPDYPPGVFEEDGETILNLWNPPKHLKSGRGELKPWFKYLKSLIPDEGERALFLKWLAAKVQKPWVRHHGLIMVSDGIQGTGRDTMIQIFAGLFGRQNICRVSLSEFLGGNFNGFLADSVMVGVSEALASSDGRYGDRAAGKNAYETMKALVSPGTNHEMLINRKYGGMSTARVYFSTFIATNHMDALPIDPHDRRFIILKNGKALPQDLAHAIQAWRQQPEHIATLWHYLAAYDLGSYDPEGYAPVTEGRGEMIEATRDTVTEVIEWMRGAGYEVVTTQKVLEVARRLGPDFQIVQAGQSTRWVGKAIAKAPGVRYIKKVMLENATRLFTINNYEKWLNPTNQRKSEVEDHWDEVETHL